MQQIIDFFRNFISLKIRAFFAGMESIANSLRPKGYAYWRWTTPAKKSSKANFERSLMLFLLLLPSLLLASDNFTVSLDTDVPLEPIAIETFEPKSSDFSQQYLNELAGVLTFDLNHNGKTAVLGREKALYVVKGESQGKNLQISLTWTKEKKAKKLATLTLSGKLSQDRRTIHEIADWIFKNLYNKKGVAATTILYTVREKNKDPTFKSEYLSEVWECDSDGKNNRQVTHEGRYIVTPCYVPAKMGYRPGSFLFVSYKLGQPKIYIGSLKDGSSHQLLTLRGNQFMPAITRDKSYISFVCDAMGNPDLFLLPYDEAAGAGKPRQIFASPRGTQGSPSFSPDGEKIAFVSNKDGNPRVYIMEVPSPAVLLKEMKPRFISRACRENTSPCWSPDGSKIAYAGMTSGTRQIWVYDLDKDKEEQVTFDKGNKENPSWAPNSFHLTFNRDDGSGKAQLCVTNLNQKDTIPITEGSTDKRFPCWEP